MKIRKVAPILLLVALVVALALAGCQQQAQKPEGGAPTTPEKPKVKTLKEGTMSFGADTAFPPFEFKEGTEYVGFDVDLAKEVCKRLGLKYEIVSTAWDGIIPNLKANKYDAIMSAMTITDDRKKEMAPTDPYIISDQSIAALKDSSIKTPEDLKGKKVGVQVDTTGQLEAEKTLGKKYANLKKYDDILTAFSDLAAGRVDAIVNDKPVSAYVIQKTYPDKMELVTTIKTNEGYGIWFKTENAALRDAVNTALKEIKADGTYNTIYKKWFGMEPEQSEGTSSDQPGGEKTE